MRGPTRSLCSDTEAPDYAIGGSKALDLDHRALAAQILAVQPRVEKTTAAPLVVKDKVFVGISGGEGLRALGLSRANRYPAARTRCCALRGDLANRSIERRSFTKLA
jgi:hypothetical protein